MEKAFDGAGAIIESLTDDTKGLAKALDTISKKIAAGNNGNKVTIPDAEYKAVKTAVTDIIGKIDKTLEAGGLTQLDTANLKTLKTAVENVGKTFASIGEITKKQGGNDYQVAVADFTKVKDAMESLGKDLTDAKEFAQNSSTASQNQAEIMLREFYRLKNTNSIILRHITILVVSFVCGLKNTISIKLN